MTKEFEMQLEVNRELFYNEESMFGIYSCDVIEYNTELIKNDYGNIALQGNTRRLTAGERYVIKFEGAYSHAKYGDFYKIVEVEAQKLDTLDGQDKFLREIISESHLASLKKAYPNEKLVDFILEGKVDVNKTKGIKEKTLAKIIDEINANMHLAILMTYLADLDIPSNKLSKILAYFKNPEEAMQMIETNIYALCDIKTFGFKTVDDIALRRGDDPKSTHRIEACIRYTLNQDTGEGHTWSIRNHLLAACSDLLSLPMTDVEATLNEMDKHDIYQTDERVGLSYIRRMEKKILANLIRIKEAFVPPNIDNIELKMKTTEEYQGFQFTDEQRKAIIEGSQHGVMVMNGVAGSGKSATVKGLIDSLGTDNYMTACLSGKAVQVLSQRGIKSSTIHRMLGFEEGKFAHDEESPLPYRVVVLDEVSMINVPLVNSVIQAIANGAKLIIVGDSGQLPAIGYGDVLRDLLATQLFPTFELTQVHRQAAQSGILSLANNIRKGIQPFQYDYSGTETFGELQDQTVISYANKDNIPNDIVNIAKAYSQRIKSPSDLFDFQVIVSNKERGSLSVKSLNIQLQAVFNNMNKPTLNRNGYEYREGDKIITQGNAYGKYKFNSVNQHHEMMERTADMKDKEAKEFLKRFKLDLFNGTMGYIHTIDKSSKTVFICIEGSEGVIGLSESEMDKIDMAYVATCHKLQGSGIKNVIFALDYGAYKLLSKQLVYTALTRASVKGVALVENNALYAAISNDASGNRRTFLADLIQDEVVNN